MMQNTDANPSNETNLEYCEQLHNTDLMMILNVIHVQLLTVVMTMMVIDHRYR